MTADGWALALPYDTNDPEFARGVEAGRLWQRLATDPYRFEQAVHAANAEMVIRMSEATGRTITATAIDDMWINLSVGDAEPAA